MSTRRGNASDLNLSLGSAVDKNVTEYLQVFPSQKSESITYSTGFSRSWKQTVNTKASIVRCVFHSEKPWSRSLSSTHFLICFRNILSFPQRRAHLGYQYANQREHYHLWLKLDPVSLTPSHSETTAALWLWHPREHRKMFFPIRCTGVSFYVLQCQAEIPLFCFSFSLSISSPFCQRSPGLCIHLCKDELMTLSENKNGFHPSLQEFLEILLTERLSE